MAIRKHEGTQMWEPTAMSWPKLYENKMLEAIEYIYSTIICANQESKYQCQLCPHTLKKNSHNRKGQSHDNNMDRMCEHLPEYSHTYTHPHLQTKDW